MSKTAVRTGFALVALFVIGYPLSVWWGNATFNSDLTLLAVIFPAFGLLAFTVMYLHIISRLFKAKLEKYLPFAAIERIASYLVLVAIVLHPVLRAIYYVINGLSLVPSPAMVLGMLGFIMLITYDIGRIFIQSNWVRKHARAIDVISTAGFYVIWIHSLILGSDLQIGLLRELWICYGVSALVATFYTLVYQR